MWYDLTMSAISTDRAETPLILSIDIGTSSVRAALFDRLGRRLEGLEARQPHEVRTTIEGASEANADALVELVCRCLDQLLSQSGSYAKEIRAVATCTFVGNILGIGRLNRPLTPLVTYADTRAGSEVKGLRIDFDEKEVHDRTGCHFHPSYLPAYFRGIARTRPPLFQQVHRWISIGEYLEMRLFGEAAVSYSVASWTGLLNRHRLMWDEPLLAGLKTRIDQLSPLVDINIPRTGLQPEFASRWPPLAKVPWFPAIGDGAAANIGSGCISAERIALTVGTTSALRAVVDYPLPHVPAGLWCYRVDRKRSLPGGALSEGGSLYAWMKGTLNFGDSSEMEEGLMKMEPDGHGLTVLPFLAGERSPGWAGHARASIHGLSLATTPLEILRAGLESVAYRIAMVFELLCPLLPEHPEIVASGGALLNSPAWLRIMSDVLGRPIAASQAQEASGRGVALLALEALGNLEDLKAGPDLIGMTCDPDLRRHGRYREAMERQKDLYEKLVKE